ncbi:hypothetical protein O9992_01000 [Vibrio lentus]|nr:hypothetical protein [Vibrio lentus]
MDEAATDIQLMVTLSLIIVAVYLYLATQSVHVNWVRIYEGSGERGWQFIFSFHELQTLADVETTSHKV